MLQGVHGILFHEEGRDLGEKWAYREMTQCEQFDCCVSVP